MKSFKNFVKEDLRKWFSKTNPEGDWKRINSKGEVAGPCAREPGEPKPKCMSKKTRAQLSKSERAAAVAVKRKHDPVADRAGKGSSPVNVSNYGKGKLSKESVEEACWVGYKAQGLKKKGNRMVPNCVPEEIIPEKWSSKYKSSIDCSNPKGFSQKAHCQSVKKNEEMEEAANAAQQAAIAIAMRKAGKKPKNYTSESESRIPKKPGQPDKSDKHSDLYTDEDPKGTIHGLKFATTDDAKESVSKIRNSGRSHAHKIQAAVAMEQRARAAGKASASAVYRRYINVMKDKTERMNEDGVAAIGGSAGPTNVTGVATSTDPVSATAVNRKKRKSVVLMNMIKRKPQI